MKKISRKISILDSEHGEFFARSFDIRFDIL